ncbi:hypothetical protein PS15p_204710 [Mucor circinelloides]
MVADARRAATPHTATPRSTIVAADSRSKQRSAAETETNTSNKERKGSSNTPYNSTKKHGSNTRQKRQEQWQETSQTKAHQTTTPTIMVAAPDKITKQQRQRRYPKRRNPK